MKDFVHQRFLMRLFQVIGPDQQYQNQQYQQQQMECDSSFTAAASTNPYLMSSAAAAAAGPSRLHHREPDSGISSAISTATRPWNGSHDHPEHDEDTSPALHNNNPNSSHDV